MFLHENPRSLNALLPEIPAKVRYSAMHQLSASGFQLFYQTGVP